MSVTLAPVAVEFFANAPNSGAITLPGGKLFTYQAGTTTKQATWTDSSQAVQNSNPIVLDVVGSTVIWCDPTLLYKFVLAPANDTDPPTSAFRTVDNIQAPTTFTTLNLLQTAAEAAAGVTPTNYGYPPGDVRRYGADPTGAADSSNAIETAANSGETRVTYGNAATYKITRILNFHTSGVTHDMRGATVTQVTTNTTAIIVGYNGSSFVKTDNTTFLGGKLVGADNGLTTTYSVGISIFPPTNNPYTLGAGCSHTSFIDIAIDSFCMCIAATGADDLFVDGLLGTNMQYHPPLSAGGYGVLAQTCFGVKVTERCRFIGGTNSRHAVYISADPGRTFNAQNVCYDVFIGGIYVDWSLVTGVTGFEYGIAIRSAIGCNVIGPVLNQTWGGVTYDLQNGTCSNLTIDGVTCYNMRSGGGGTTAATEVNRTAGSFRCTNVVVRNVNATLANSNGVGVRIVGCDNVTSGGHTISGAGYSYGIYLSDCNRVVLDPSVVQGGFSRAIHFDTLVCDTVQFGRHIIVGGGITYEYNTTPTNLRFTYPRSFAVASNGAGSVTVTNDEYPAAASVVTDANGFVVTFNAEISTASYNFLMASNASNIASVYYRSSTATTVTFGVLGISGGALTALPAATNAYNVNIVVQH